MLTTKDCNGKELKVGTACVVVDPADSGCKKGTIIRISKIRDDSRPDGAVIVESPVMKARGESSYVYLNTRIRKANISEGLRLKKAEKSGEKTVDPSKSKFTIPVGMDIHAISTAKGDPDPYVPTTEELSGIEELPTWIKTGPLYYFKVGDTIKIDPTSRYYHQAPDATGNILHLSSHSKSQTADEEMGTWWYCALDDESTSDKLYRNSYRGGTDLLIHKDSYVESREFILDDCYLCSPRYKFQIGDNIKLRLSKLGNYRTPLYNQTGVITEIGESTNNYTVEFAGNKRLKCKGGIDMFILIKDHKSANEPAFASKDDIEYATRVMAIKDEQRN